MAGRNLWNEIRRRRNCPHCGHLSSQHERIDEMSEILGTDIWNCPECSAEGRSCLAKGKNVVDLAEQIIRRKKKLPEPFGGGKL